MLGNGKRKATRKKVKKRRKKAKGVERPLKGTFPGGKVIYATYKGKEYKAWVRTNGGIRFRGRTYDTPSGAAKVIIERGAVNGWNFWKYKDGSGNLATIGNLRK